jgi:hypothetical protein
MRNAIVTTALALALLAAAAPPARAGEDGAGIWLYKTDVTTTFINLTSYTLKWYGDNVEEHDGCCPGTCGDVVFSYDGLKIGPMSTWQEAVDDGCSTDPISWAGTSAWVFSDDNGWLADSGFDIVMVQQTSASSTGDLHHGTWFALSPRDGVANSWQTTSATTPHCGRYPNPVDDKKMHNVMNLINNKVMITLYSVNNRDLVVVAEEINPNQQGWDDCNAYTSYPLDFVDNAGDSVPGQ